MSKTSFIIVFIGLIICSSIFAQDSTNTISQEDKQWIVSRALESLVFVEGGTFMMGDAGYTDSLGMHHYFGSNLTSRPAHKVTLDSYSIMKYEVIFKEFDLFTDATGQELIKKRYIGYKHRKPELSASGENWNQAKDYCKWLGELAGIEMTLPTDAQWEYAARSRGKAVRYATDNGKLEPGRNCLGPDDPWFGNPPGTYPPNPLGIYDMQGGKAEWVLDWWHTFDEKPKINPVSGCSGYYKFVVRGFKGVGVTHTLYTRGYRDPSSTGAGIGVRCVANNKKPILIEP